MMRLLFLGLTTTEIAKRLHKTPRQIRYATSLPAFQREAAQLDRELLQGLDKKITRLLYHAVKAMRTLLKHPDWRAREAALQLVFRLHGRFIDRIDITGTVDHSGQINHLVGHGLMSDETRTLARQLLKSLPKPGPSPLLSRTGDAHEIVEAE